MTIDRETLAEIIAEHLGDGVEVEISRLDLELPVEEVSEELIGTAVARRLLDELE